MGLSDRDYYKEHLGQVDPHAKNNSSFINHQYDTRFNVPAPDKDAEKIRRRKVFEAVREQKRLDKERQKPTMWIWVAFTLLLMALIARISYDFLF